MSSPHPYRSSLQRESSQSVAGSESASESTPPPTDPDSLDLQLKGQHSTKESRRMRGEISCAECRRLKIKCDRTVPCSTCTKRGCAALCPNGTIPPGDGSRFVFAATDHLRQKMTKMEARMHSLEDALAIVQSSESDEIHPLLAIPWEDGEGEEPQFRGVPEESVTVPRPDALGMLHVEEAVFFGPSGGSESLLLKAKELEEQISHQPRPKIQDLDPSYLPPEIINLCRSFPFTPPGISPLPVQSMIEFFLPSIDRTIELCDAFTGHLSWMFRIVSRNHMVNELMPAVYKLSDDSYGPHDLALLLIILAVGAMVDLDLPPYNLEAQHYYELARAALTLQPVLTEQSVVTVKVLHLMSIYNGLSGKESNLEQSYTLLNFAGRMALGIGLHVDPSLWGFQGKEAYERRAYFWELLASIFWQSMITGRPPVILASAIGCKSPTTVEEELYTQGEFPLGTGFWAAKATEACLLPVVDVVLAAKLPPYASILDIDRSIRNFASVEPAPDDQNANVATSMRAFVRSHYHDLILLFLHRGLFAQAMIECPEAPLASTHAMSVSAAYQSACVVLEDTRLQYVKKPLLCARIWRIWSHAFSAAIVIGAVAIREKQLNLEPPAFQQFELACLLFQKAAEISTRAARALPLLIQMRQKARRARDWPGLSKADIDDELAIFGGHTRPGSNPGPTASHVSASTPASASSGPSSSQQARQYHAFAAFTSHPLSASRTSINPSTHNPPPPLPEAWSSLYSEVPEPHIPPSGLPPQEFDPNSAAQPAPHGTHPTFDIQWSSFMNSYGNAGPSSRKPPRS